MRLRRPMHPLFHHVHRRVAAREAAGRNFLLWAGHGEAMYLPLRTFERVIEAAPRHLIGFIFAEMESVDEHMQQVVKEIFALRDELLSIPDLFLGMKSPPDPGYIAHGVNGHNYNFDASRIVPMGRIRSVSKVVTV